MRIFSGLRNPRPPDRSRAWVCAALNQFAFPGLGTILAGRPIGLVQAAIMLAGFGLVMAFLLWFFTVSARFLANPGWDENTWRQEYRQLLWAGKWGFVLCLVAWCWSLASSVGIVRRASKMPPAFPVT